MDQFTNIYTKSIQSSNFKNIKYTYVLSFTFTIINKIGNEVYCRFNNSGAATYSLHVGSILYNSSTPTIYNQIGKVTLRDSTHFHLATTDYTEADVGTTKTAYLLMGTDDNTVDLNDPGGNPVTISIGSNTVIGSNAVSIGSNNIVTESSAVGIGLNNRLLSLLGIAFGWQNTIYSPQSVAFGCDNTIGESERAQHQAILAHGIYNTALGKASHAEGEHTYVGELATGAHAEGLGTIASAPYLHVSGFYNEEDTLSRFITLVGNGDDENTRHNAFGITQEGNLVLWDGTDEVVLTPAKLKDLLALLPTT